MLADLDPQTALETVLTNRIISLSWRLNRVPKIHAAAFTCIIEGTIQEYEDDLDAPKELFGEAVLETFSGASILDTIETYACRIESNLYKTLTQLQKLQKLRQSTRQEATHVEKTNPIPTPISPRTEVRRVHPLNSTDQNEKTNPIPTQACHCAEQSDKAISTSTTPNPDQIEKTNPISPPNPPREHPKPLFKTPYDPMKHLRPAPIHRPQHHR
jgi:hypothetical protein